jgi:hypothetical protein
LEDKIAGEGLSQAHCGKIAKLWNNLKKIQLRAKLHAPIRILEPTQKPEGDAPSGRTHQGKHAGRKVRPSASVHVSS